MRLIKMMCRSGILTAYGRDISATPRLLKVSDEFVCPVGFEAGWANLCRKIEVGESLKPHLSKAHWSLRNQDGLLDDWGVHHFFIWVSSQIQESLNS